jgi:benzoyl-CoA reductase/2-hydroxyglutaryl-CoA dehydratase subunit BcrC/BadD/HgdB
MLARGGWTEMVSDPVVPFYEIVSRGDAQLRGLAGEGNRLMGYFCTYTPVELLHATGFIPIRIMGQAAEIEKAYNLIPDFICPYLRKAVERGLNGYYGSLSGIVQGYTCDVTCGLTNIWKENIGGGVFHILPLPYLNLPESQSFLRSGIADLVRKLEQAGGEFSEQRLDDALNLYARIRTLMKGLYTLRYQRHLPFSAKEFLYVINAGFVIPPERYRNMLEDLVKALPDAPAANTGIPVLVSGSLIEDPEFLGILEESGGLVVADDLCTGYRTIDPPDGKGGDPVARLIDRIMNRFPCPTRSSAEDRLPRILDLMKRSGARAVVFLIQKFCTPHLGDHPTLKAGLRKLNIPSIMIEIEEAGTMEGQNRTRLVSFFEMLGS